LQPNCGRLNKLNQACNVNHNIGKIPQMGKTIYFTIICNDLQLQQNTILTHEYPQASVHRHRHLSARGLARTPISAMDKDPSSPQGYSKMSRKIVYTV